MIDLKQFCSVDQNRVASIGQPFSDGPWTFATDGRIIVRVPRCCYDVPENPNAPKNVNARIFDSNPNNGKFRPLPPFTAPTKKKCLDCNGGKRKCECPHCQGGHICDECDGTGLIEEVLPAVKFGQQLVNPKYLALIATLPGVMLANAVDQAGYGALTFRFDGGEGRLMPMTRDYDA